ncbi:hypothetical protein [Alkalihalobacillus pseudalcaliphilus]|uniref:hypothetical protein n=1 Tax=Alkalihalobacillus pseudalcaliphilus TaxID=79884 RepID=UPI00064D8BE7|nr:hypothetical protein [Alkalihalobacillus pseudalcaliphilus]KMK74686.1 hypothetical protein AB990_19530 [Alkalihalobacillus pseudalcaliphilus]
MKDFLIKYVDNGGFILALWVATGIGASVIRWNTLGLDGFHLAVIDRFHDNQILFSPIIMALFILMGAFFIHIASEGLHALRNYRGRWKIPLVIVTFVTLLIVVYLLVSSMVGQAMAGFYLSAGQTVILLVYIGFQYGFHHHKVVAKSIRPYVSRFLENKEN